MNLLENLRYFVDTVSRQVLSVLRGKGGVPFLEALKEDLPSEAGNRAGQSRRLVLCLDSTVEKYTNYSVGLARLPFLPSLIN